MKLTGFIREHSSHIGDALSAPPFNHFSHTVYHDKVNLLNYLKGGVPIAVTMMLLYSLLPNEKNKIIGGITIFTDGEWVWPSYLEYYLRVCDIELDSDFVDHIRRQNYCISNIDQEHKKRASDLIERLMKA